VGAAVLQSSVLVGDSSAIMTALKILT